MTDTSSANDGVIFWDFDGTLATRPGQFRGAMVAALDEHAPGHGVTREVIRGLEGVYPWDRWREPHPHLTDPELWWQPMLAAFAERFAELGWQSACEPLAQRARAHYVDASAYELYQDAVPALTQAHAAGWRNWIVSNHVPELDIIIDALGLRRLLDGVTNSALTGYEKPHAGAFAAALAAAGQPHPAWMIGDNPEADYAGATARNIPAVLICRQESRPAASGLRHAATLPEALQHIQPAPGRSR